MNTEPIIADHSSQNNLTVIYKKQEVSSKSLLRYPGGKTRGLEEIIQYFPANVQELCAPFFGGGSIEIFMASKGVKVFGYDIFKPLVEFWQCAIREPKKLAEKVQEYFPLSKQRFYELQATQTLFKTKLERAAVFYVLNRSSFSGSTLSGGMSPEHPRFTQTAIERLKEFNNPNLVVKHADFKRSILLHKESFLYLDPPYLIENTLYGKKGNTHKGFDHSSLFETLKQRDNWIMSYNDCDEIRKMYKNYLIITPSWRYGMSNDKASKEVLIFSQKLSSKWQPNQLPAKLLNTP